MYDWTTIIAVIAWGLAEARLFLFQRQWARERGELLDRVQGWRPSVEGKRQKEKGKTTAGEESVVPGADVVGARRAFRSLVG